MEDNLKRIVSEVTRLSREAGLQVGWEWWVEALRAMLRPVSAATRTG